MTAPCVEIKLYAKKRETIRAVQWTGEMTPSMHKLIGGRDIRIEDVRAVGWIADREVHVDHARALMLNGTGWFARVGDWVFSASGEDLKVIGNELFLQIYEEVEQP